MKKANLIFKDKRINGDEIIEMKIWQVPDPVTPSTHFLKYSLYYGRSGQRIICYDNERGKGDHRHYRDHEEKYQFTTVEKLVSDFIADVRKEQSNDRRD